MVDFSDWGFDGLEAVPSGHIRVDYRFEHRIQMGG